jgi:integrase/recombinase XerC
MGLNLGVCDFTLARVKGEKVTKYRDTSGINSDTFSAILATCDLATLAGKLDYALLRLLWSNALRRAFVSKLSIGDFDRTNGTLKFWVKAGVLNRKLSIWVMQHRRLAGSQAGKRDDRN